MCSPFQCQPTPLGSKTRMWVRYTTILPECTWIIYLTDTKQAKSTLLCKDQRVHRPAGAALHAGWSHGGQGAQQRKKCLSRRTLRLGGLDDGVHGRAEVLKQRGLVRHRQREQPVQERCHLLRRAWVQRHLAMPAPRQHTRREIHILGTWSSEIQHVPPYRQLDVRGKAQHAAHSGASAAKLRLW